MYGDISPFQKSLKAIANTNEIEKENLQEDFKIFLFTTCSIYPYLCVLIYKRSSEIKGKDWVNLIMNYVSCSTSIQLGDSSSFNLSRKLLVDG